MFLVRRVLALSIVILVALLSIPFLAPNATGTVLVRGVYGRDSSASGLDLIQGAGSNAVTYNGWWGRAGLDALAARGMKALIWLGEYDRTASCQFELSDDGIRGAVEPIAGHPAIVAYQLSDEPNYARLHCPNAVDDHKRRSALIHSLDPSKPTYVTISTWDGREGFPYQYFASAADIMGLVVYPCSGVWDSWGGCQFKIIDQAIAEADRHGVARYWAVMQYFADTYYRLPTADEMRTQFDHWAASRMEGYFLYHWQAGDVDSKPDILKVLEEENASLAGPTSPSSPSPTASETATSPSPTPTQSSSPEPSQSPSPEPSQGDTQPPSPPGNLTARWMKSRVVVSWSAATDDSGMPVRYRVYRDGALMGVTSRLTLGDHPARGIAHTYEVVAVDVAGNLSASATFVLEPGVYSSPTRGASDDSGKGRG